MIIWNIFLNHDYMEYIYHRHTDTQRQTSHQGGFSGCQNKGSGDHCDYMVDVMTKMVDQLVSLHV